MAGLLPDANTCCDPCSEPVSVAVPGPTGATGADGSDGADGLNAYTVTTAGFNMPAELANVTISVSSSAWASIGQVVYVTVGGALGYFEVVTKPGSTSLELKNLEDTASSAYTSNSAPGTLFASGATVSPAGLQGPAGVMAAGTAPNDATYITQTPNGTLTSEQALSGLATGIVKNTTGTGVLSIAADGTDYLSSTTGLKQSNNLSDVASAATSRANLGLALGTDVQAYDAFLASLAALGTAADKLLYTTGVNTAAESALTSYMRTLLDDSDYLAAQQTLKLFATNQGRLCAHTIIDMNAAGDTALAILDTAQAYIIESVIVYTASISLTTATAGLFTAAGGGGTTLAADQALSALTSGTKYLALTLQAITTTDWRTESTLYFRVGTPQGAAALAAVLIFGKALSN